MANDKVLQQLEKKNSLCLNAPSQSHSGFRNPISGHSLVITNDTSRAVLRSEIDPGPSADQQVSRAVTCAA